MNAVKQNNVAQVLFVLPCDLESKQMFELSTHFCVDGSIWAKLNIWWIDLSFQLIFIFKI